MCGTTFQWRNQEALRKSLKKVALKKQNPVGGALCSASRARLRRSAVSECGTNKTVRQARQDNKTVSQGQILALARGISRRKKGCSQHQRSPSPLRQRCAGAAWIILRRVVYLIASTKVSEAASVLTLETLTQAVEKREGQFKPDRYRAKTLKVTRTCS